MSTATAEKSIEELRENFPKNFNPELLSQLVTWAYADDQRMDDFMAKHFPDWGNWKQELWAEEVRNGVCKTAFCMAGQAVVQSGFALHLTVDEEEEEWDAEKGEYVKTGITHLSADMCYPAVKNGKDARGRQKYRRTGDNVEISTAAREALGLTYAEADRLFDGDNSIHKISYLIQGFAAARGVEIDLDDEIKDLGRRYDSLDNLSAHLYEDEWYEEIISRLFPV